jgi:methylenetetrahydrofolate dehydrogenase (NADP+)/methenyltetrahydrofolate cyclohydrolase
MTAQILDGKAIAKRVREEVRVRAERFAADHGRPPGLDVVLVGDDPASQVYVRNKERAAANAGIRGAVHRLPADAAEASVLALVERLSQSPEVDGILVQLPLPAHIDARKVLDALDPAKDVDGLHPVNAGLLAVGRPGLRPCTPRGCMRMLEEANIDLAGRHAVVVGRSVLVGKPLALMLLERHATVTIAHSRTRDLAGECKRADVLVAAVGKPTLVAGDWVKPEAVVIDVGINRTAEGTLVGDVDYGPASKRASFITPVPGGVGPMTIAMLLDNTVDAAEARVPR